MGNYNVYRCVTVNHFWCLASLSALLTIVFVFQNGQRFLKTDKVGANVDQTFSRKHSISDKIDYFSLNYNDTTKALNPSITPLPLLTGILNKGISEQEASKTISVTATDTINDYLELNEIRDLRQAANPNVSKVFLLGKEKQFRIGDEVRVRIELYDGWERRLLTGGDVLRVWVVDLKSNCTGYVIDHGNGSYTGVVKALWIGQPEIKVALATTKEHISFTLNRIKQNGIFYYMSGIYDNGNVSEHTNCTTIPWVDGHMEVCNLTSVNFGMSWYCGKPKNKRLSCKDWAFHSGNRRINLPTTVEQLLKQPRFVKIPQTLRIGVTGDYKTAQSNELLCNKRPKNTTWHDKVPTGYFYENQWRVLECTYPFEATKSNYLNCLKGRPLLFLGDSTIRYWFVYLTEFLNLTFTLGRWDEIKDKAWQRFAYAERKDFNISISWAPHELPFYGAKSFTKNLRSVGSRLDEIGSNSSAIVVLHWYLHVARSSHENYREHVRDARRAVDRLLKRAPDVEVLVKGPHAIKHPINIEPHDYIRRYQEQILYEEFKDLQDRVIYLDEWDMTVGSENINVHPPKMTNLQMIHHLLSYACFR